MRQLSKQEHVTALFVIAMYYWYHDDRFNARNALQVAIHIAKEIEHVSPEQAEDVSIQRERNRGRALAEILAFDFPSKRAAHSA
jgi:hypothetical protein